MFGFGGWVGVFINGYCCDRFFRRWSIFGGVIVCIVGIIFIVVVVNSVMIFVGRFVIGLVVGFFSIVVFIYNSEISLVEVRGVMVGIW